VREVWEQIRKPLCKHRLARSGRANEQQVMATRRGDLKRKACNRLSTDIGKVWSEIDG